MTGSQNLSEGRGTGGSPGWPRRALRLAAAVAALLVLLYGVAAVLFSTLVHPAELAGWLEPRAEAALNRPVELGGVRVRVFPRLAIEIDSLEIRDPPAFGDSRLARAAAVELRVAILPLLRRRITVDEVVVDDPELRMTVRSDGVSNYGDLLPASREPSPEPAKERGRRLSFRVRELRVEGATLAYSDATSSRSLILGGADLSGDLRRLPDGGWEIRPELEADSVELAAGGERVLSLQDLRSRLDLRSGPRFGWVEIRDGSLSLASLDARLSGRVDGVRDSVRQIELRASVAGAQLADVLSLLPARTRRRIPGEVRGIVEGDLTVRGEAGPGRTPRATGRASVDGASLVLSDGAPALTDGTLRARLRADTLELERAEGTLLGGPAALRGHLALDSARSFRAELQAEPAISRLLRLRQATGVTGRGSLAVRLAVTGTSGELHATELRGRVEIRDAGFLLRREERGAEPLQLEIPAGSIELEGREARWSSLPLILGGDRLLFTGTLAGLLDPVRPSGDRRRSVPPVLRGTLRTDRFDLDRIFPVPADRPSYGRLAFGHLGDRPVSGRTAAEWARDLRLSLPDSLPLEGRVAVMADTLSFRDYLLTGVDAQMKFGRQVLELHPASAGLWRGDVESRLTLGVGGEPTQPFSFHLETDSLEAARLLDHVTPMSRFVTGRLDLELDVAGRMDTLLLPVPSTLVGAGRFAVDRGRLPPNAVTRALGRTFDLPALDSLDGVRWTGRFSLTGHGVRLDSARLRSSLADFTMAGTVGYGGAVELGIRMDYPVSRLSELSRGGGALGGETLERLLESVERDGATTVPLELRVSGQPPGLRVALETGALRERLTTGARRAVSDSVTRVLEEGRREIRQRSSRLLRRLLGATDSLPPAPPDTTRVDTTATGRDTAADQPPPVHPVRAARAAARRPGSSLLSGTESTTTPSPGRTRTSPPCASPAYATSPDGEKRSASGRPGRETTLDSRRFPASKTASSSLQ